MERLRNYSKVAVREFMNRFRFFEENRLKIGIERECFLLRGGKVVPLAPQVLEFLKKNSQYPFCFGYEFSACQLEDRLPWPSSLAHIIPLLQENERVLKFTQQRLCFSRLYKGIGPEDMPLDYYPDERYRRIVSKMSRESLKAACRVAGVHIHIGMPDSDTALMVYNHVIGYFDRLCQIGMTDKYDDQALQRGYSERIDLFRKYLLNGNFKPPSYQSWDDFYLRALTEGFSEDPRRLWDFIRISPKGSIEFRVFDSTSDLGVILEWARFCREICEECL